MSKKVIARLIFSLSISLVVSCVSKKTDSIDTTVSVVSEHDQVMNRAISEAKKTFPGFLKRFNAPLVGDSNFIVKVMVQEEKGIEHLWVRNLTVTDSLFSGVVDNQPQFVTSVAYNGKITFTEKDVSDWAFTDSDGVREGSYTLKVLLHGMPSKDATAYRDMFGWDDTVGESLQKDITK